MVGKNSDPDLTVLPSVLEEVTGYFTCPGTHYCTTHRGTTSVLLGTCIQLK